MSIKDVELDEVPASGRHVEEEEEEEEEEDVLLGYGAKLITWPIQSLEKVFVDGDAELHIVVVPEAFRMWFYYGFLLFTAIAIFVSVSWSERLNLEDNVIIDLFGGNNICIFYDFPPFSYFGAVLWLPQTLNLLLYEAFDQFRVYDEYIEGGVSKTFYTLYSISTIFEMFAGCYFLQITAVDPEVNLHMHTLPFLLLIYALWTMSFKRFMYLVKVYKIKEKSPRSYWVGTAYVVLLLACVISKSCILWPNFFGAKLWTKPGLEWTIPFLKYVVYVWMFLTVFAPIIIYSVITQRLEKVKLVINRSTTKKQR